MLISRKATLIAALLGAAAFSAAWAGQPGTKSQPAMSECCAAMKKTCSDEMSNQKVSDVRLDRLVMAMNDAPAAGKVEAMAAVINELVKDRAEAREHMVHMRAATSEHALQHVMAAAPADMSDRMKTGMDGCSMMRGTAGAGR